MCNRARPMTLLNGRCRSEWMAAGWSREPDSGRGRTRWRVVGADCCGGRPWADRGMRRLTPLLAREAGLPFRIERSAPRWLDLPGRFPELLCRLPDQVTLWQRRVSGRLRPRADCQFWPSHRAQLRPARVQLPPRSPLRRSESPEWRACCVFACGCVIDAEGRTGFGARGSPRHSAVGARRRRAARRSRINYAAKGAGRLGWADRGWVRVMGRRVSGLPARRLAPRGARPRRRRRALGAGAD